MTVTPKKIVYGVCGIGNGHTFRQLPIVRHLADEGNRIVMFAYDASYDHFTQTFADYPNVSVERVAVPFYMGKAEGLDFTGTAYNPVNKKDFLTVNCEAMARAEQILGKPDLVISDYEPVSAQYGYAHGAPVVTIDQQSKYLAGKFPEPLNGETYQDEVMRLRMFFPLAAGRLACSFFRVPKSHAGSLEQVEILPPVLREEVIALKDHPKTETPSILIYLTAQRPLDQSLEEIARACEAVPSAEYHVFAPKNQTLPPDTGHLHFYHHGDARFEDVLGGCHGVVSTAGHTLLSEAMYLGTPVYAMPLPLYEQQMNAWIIQDYGFGLSNPALTAETLDTFVMGLPQYAASIAHDESILLRGAGQDRIIARIEQMLKQREIAQASAVGR